MLRAKQLAPDLRFARDRWTPEKLLAWLKDPKAVKADTTMPKIPLTDEEAKDAVAYLLGAELSPPPAQKPFERLPVLDRKVTFDEVDQKVLHRTCWHCHAEPDYAIGDGGPGNSGGFGFKPRGLNLASYEGISAGIKDKQTGERFSVLTKRAGPPDTVKSGDSTPLILQSLLARHAEEKGADTGARAWDAARHAAALGRGHSAGRVVDRAGSPAMRLAAALFGLSLCACTKPDPIPESATPAPVTSVQSAATRRPAPRRAP